VHHRHHLAHALLSCARPNVSFPRRWCAGYLSCNRFGEVVGGAHAGMTAEGDNSVLMQKVAKELLDLLRSGQLTLRSQDDSVQHVGLPLLTNPLNPMMLTAHSPLRAGPEEH